METTWLLVTVVWLFQITVSKAWYYIQPIFIDIIKLIGHLRLSYESKHIYNCIILYVCCGRSCSLFLWLRFDDSGGGFRKTPHFISNIYFLSSSLNVNSNTILLKYYFLIYCSRPSTFQLPLEGFYEILFKQTNLRSVDDNFFQS